MRQEPPIPSFLIEAVKCQLPLKAVLLVNLRQMAQVIMLQTRHCLYRVPRNGALLRPRYFSQKHRTYYLFPRKKRRSEIACVTTALRISHPIEAETVLRVSRQAV